MNVFPVRLANFQKKEEIKKKEIGQFPKETKKGRKRNWQVFRNRNRYFFFFPVFERIKFEHFSNAANEIVVE